MYRQADLKILSGPVHGLCMSGRVIAARAAAIAEADFECCGAVLLFGTSDPVLGFGAIDTST